LQNFQKEPTCILIPLEKISNRGSGDIIDSKFANFRVFLGEGHGFHGLAII